MEVPEMELGSGTEARAGLGCATQGEQAQVGALPRKLSLGASPQKCVFLPCAPEQGEEVRSWPQDQQPPLLPGQHGDKGQDKSTEDDGPASEPLFKVLDTPLSEGDEPTTLPAQLDPGRGVQMEGFLGRKHDLEGPNKKASNR